MSDADLQIKHYLAKLEGSKLVHEYQITLLNGVLGFATLTIKSLILINGGAVIALLAFLQSIWSKDNSTIINSSGETLSYFLCGIGAGILTAVLAYFVQCYYEAICSYEGEKVFYPENHTELNSQITKLTTKAMALRVIAIIIGLSSFCFFCMGSYSAIALLKI